MKGYLRHAIATKLLKYPVICFLRIKFRIHYDPMPRLKAPFLVLANHVTDFDPILAGSTFPQPLYYVASEHVFRHGLGSKLLQYFFAPISRLKGRTDAAAVKDILRYLKDGRSVLIFAEGNRSFDGRTCPISPATGKLARLTGVPLVTYRLEGGYLSSPRWSDTLRRGKMHGGVVRIYSPETLQGMTNGEVSDAIAADLYENAYERQLPSPVVFHGKRLAERMERALFLCPRCGAVDSMHSQDDRLRCRCGMEVRYTPTGMLEGDAGFTTVPQWEDWQQEALRKRAEALEPGETLFSDEAVQLTRITPEHQTEAVCESRLTMTRDSLICGEYDFPMDKITEMAVFGHCNLAFTCEHVHYELRSTQWQCGRKYCLAWQCLKGR